MTSRSSKGFIDSLRKEFNFKGDSEKLIDLLNEREDSGLYQEFQRVLEWRNQSDKRGFSVLSNQLAYRLQHVREELERNIGLDHFQYVWFSPEAELQKPFVGFKPDTSSTMDTSKIDIFYIACSKEQIKL